MQQLQTWAIIICFALGATQLYHYFFESADPNPILSLLGIVVFLILFIGVNKLLRGG